MVDRMIETDRDLGLANVRSILFVCLGNICRSPAAELVAASLIERNHLTAADGSAFVIDSAGTAAYHIGERPDRRTVAEAERRGMVVTHRARQVRAADFREFDLILAMDGSNLANLRRIEPRDASAIVALFAPFEHGASSTAVVPDPYYDGPEAFVACFDQCERAATGLFASIVGQDRLNRTL